MFFFGIQCFNTLRTEGNRHNVKLSLGIIKQDVLRSIAPHSLMSGEYPASYPGAFTPGKTYISTHRTGGCVGPKTGLEL
jgi:hypothetical protein